MNKTLKKLSSPFIKFYGYLKKDILLIVKRKKYLYLTILLPLLIASLFLFMLNPATLRIKIGICDLDNTKLSRQAFENMQDFEAELYKGPDCMPQLRKDIETGKISLGLEVKKGFSENINNLKQGKLTVYYDNTDPAFSRLVAWKIDSSLYPYKTQIIDNINNDLKNKISIVSTNVDLALALTPQTSQLGKRIAAIDTELKKIEELDTDFLVSPINTEKKPIFESKFTKDAGIAFIFPIIALFVLLMLSSTSFIYDKKTGFLTRVKSSTSPINYLLAKLAFFLLLAIFQFLIILVVFLLYGASYNFSSIGLIQTLLFISIINTLLGLLIGLISDNEGIAVLFALIISFPLMLLSGIFFPLQTMPKFVEFLAGIMPLQSQIEAVKASMLFTQQISNEWIYFALGLFVIVYLLIGRKE